MTVSLQFYGGYTQLATYWQFANFDGFGKRVFATPVTILVRWDDRTDLVIKKGEEDVPSKASIFVQQDMQVGEYLALGDQTGISDPQTIPETAYQILDYRKNTSMMGDAYFRTVTL